MKALLFERSLPRYAAARVISSLGSGRGVSVAPLRLTDLDQPALPSGTYRLFVSLRSRYNAGKGIDQTGDTFTIG